MRPPALASTLRDATAILRRPGLLALAYALNLLCAALLVLPVTWALSTVLDQSLEADRLWTALDPAWLAEQYATLPATALLMWLPLIGLAATLYGLTQSWLAGVALTFAAQAGAPLPLRALLAEGLRWLPRLLRVTFWSWLFYFVWWSGYASVLGGVRHLWRDSLAERPLVLSEWAVRIVALAVFWWLQLVFDYAKVRCVLHEEPHTLRAIAWSFGFTVRAWRHTLRLGLCLLLAGVAITGLYAAVAGWLPEQTVPGVVALFLWRQCSVLARVALRLLNWMAEAVLYRALRPPLPTPPEPAWSYEI